MSDQVSLEHNSFRGVILGGFLVIFASFLSDHLATVRDVKNLSRVIIAEIELDDKDADAVVGQIDLVKSDLDNQKIPAKHWFKSNDKMFFEQMPNLFGKLDSSLISDLIEYSYSKHNIETLLIAYSDEKRIYISNSKDGESFDYTRWSDALQRAKEEISKQKQLGKNIIANIEAVNFFTPLKFW